MICVCLKFIKYSVDLRGPGGINTTTMVYLQPTQKGSYCAIFESVNLYDPCLQQEYVHGKKNLH